MKQDPSFLGAQRRIWKKSQPPLIALKQGDSVRFGLFLLNIQFNSRTFLSPDSLVCLYHSLAYAWASKRRRFERNSRNQPHPMNLHRTQNHFFQRLHNSSFDVFWYTPHHTVQIIMLHIILLTLYLSVHKLVNRYDESRIKAYDLV